MGRARAGLSRSHAGQRIAVKAKGAAVIRCTFADGDGAAAIAEQLADKGLIACANLMLMRSFDVWNGEREDGRKCAALMKTRSDLLYAAVKPFTPTTPPPSAAGIAKTGP